jgi:hypothetical protein
MTGLKTNILFDLYNRLSLLMPSIALPVRLYERRKGYTGHTLETTLSGLTVRLDEDKQENLEDGFPTSSTLSIQGQKMKASIFAFKRNQSLKYTKDEGIIFSINGQTHGHLSKSFFSRDSVGMGYLVDSLLVIVDCTELQGRFREDLFMNSRDRLCTGDLRSEIETSFENLTKNHQGLRELRERRRREDIADKLGDSKPLADVIEDLIKKSPTLSKLFIDGVRLPNPFKLTQISAQKIFEGKKFPSFFKLIEEFSQNKPKECPINVKFRIQYKTDAMNDYFDRDSDPGIFSLKINGHEIQSYLLNLWNGYANLNVQLPQNSCVGDLLHFVSTVNDISGVEPFVNEFYVKIQEPAKKQKSTKGERKLPSSDEKGEDSKQKAYLDLPNVWEIRRVDWDKHHFNDESALRVVNNAEQGYDFFVNMDNIHLLTEQKANLKIETKLQEARYKYGMVLIGIAILNDYRTKNNQKPNGEEDVYEKISSVSKIISPILLPMISSLGDLEIEKPKEVEQDN